MQRLTIERGASTDFGTFGVAAVGTMTWHSLELPWRNNRPNLSCILPGVYRAIPFDSPHFGRVVYKLIGVPGRSDAEIHPANWAGDTEKGLFADLKGCLSIGESEGDLVPPGRSVPQPAIERSEFAFDALMALTGGAEIEVAISWQPGAEPGSYDPSEPLA
jgi:hypothetical protein